MPDIPNRTKEEEELMLLILILLAGYFDQASLAIGSTPGRQLPDAYYRAMADEVAETVQPQLAGLHYEAAERMAESVGVELTEQQQRQMQADADEWARTRAEQLGIEVSDRTRGAIDEALGKQAAGELTDEEFEEELGKIYGEDRAEGIGVTETTGAASAGEVGAGKRIGRELEVVVTGKWITEKDSKVCPICRPLHNSLEEVWGTKFPSGPPAHPRCRCYLVWDVKQRIEEVSEV